MTDIDSLFVAPPLPAILEDLDPPDIAAINDYGLQCFRRAFDQKAGPVLYAHRCGNNAEWLKCSKQLFESHDNYHASWEWAKLYPHPPLIAAQSEVLAKVSF